MTDEAIINLYFKRDERAIPETDLKYGGYCHSIAYSILQDYEDTRECLNDTWLRTWNSIPPNRPQNFRIFLAKISRNLAFDRYRAEHSQKRGGGETPECIDELSECIAGAGDAYEELSAKELGAAVNSFLKSIPENDANIFIRRYFYVETVSDIAKRYKLKENNASVKLNRVRKKLRKYLEKEGYI